MEFDVYSPPNAQVGSLPLTADWVVCHDFTSIREAMGRDVYGIVGMDFLQAWIVAIETQRDPQWGTPIPFCYGRRKNMFILATVAHDVTNSFVVDTGHAGTGNLQETLFSHVAGSRNVDATGAGMALTMSGMKSTKVARLSHLSVGPFRHENLRFQSGRENSLGLGYFSRYRVTIDFPHQRLYLAEGKHFADRDIGDTCGLRYLFRSGHLVVFDVDAKGPAYAAGVQRDDVIVTLSGKPVSEWAPGEIGDVLSTEGKAVQMTVERDGKQIEVSFTPKEYD
jgi:hypothetical protein